MRKIKYLTKNNTQSAGFFQTDTAVNFQKPLDKIPPWDYNIKVREFQYIKGGYSTKYKSDHLLHITSVLPCIGRGILCGALTGGIIFLFRLGAKKAEELSRAGYRLALEHPTFIPAVLLVILLLAMGMVFLHRYVPESRGGGIPRSEGILRGILDSHPVKTLSGTVLGSFLSYFCGLPLGSEGPAVLIGTSVGGICGGFAENASAWRRYVMTGGAGAGFAVATGAPLSAILFALEEIHKRFTPILVLSVSVSVVSASYVHQLLCELTGAELRLFDIETLASPVPADAIWLLLLGIIVALAAGGFDASLAMYGAISKRSKYHLTRGAKLVFVFLLTGILGFTFSEGIYSGHDVIHDVLHPSGPFFLLFGILAVRMLMMLFVTSSGATGGIFVPTLAIGALTAAIAARLLILIGMREELYCLAVVLGMCAFLGGTLRAPLMASVLFLELTGQFTDMCWAALVIFTVNTITELLHQTPFYDRTLENLVHNQNRGLEPTIACFEMKISPGSFVVGKSIRDILWPASSVLISTKRAHSGMRDTVNDGEKKLHAGDTVVLRCRYFDEEELLTLLRGLVGSDYPILRMNTGR